MRRPAAWLLGTTALISSAWMASASAIWSYGTATPYGVTGWLAATQWWGANWWCNLWLVVGAAVPTIYLGIAAVIVWVSTKARRGKRLKRLSGGGLMPTEAGVTDNHGHSQWRSMESAKRLFHGPDPRHGGVVVGEAYRVDQDPGAMMPFNPHDRSTWGKGGTQPLLIDPCTSSSGHSIVFAGSGSFKTASAVSTILHWTGSSVILDPSTELGPMLHDALAAQEKTVAHIGVPIDEDDDRTTGFNVLDWINITHPEAEIHVRTVVSWIYKETPNEDPFFGPTGRDVITCLLAHLCWTDPADGQRHLAALAEMIAVPEDDLRVLLSAIHRSSRSNMARLIAGTLMRIRADETFSGIVKNASTGIAWLFTLAYSEMLSYGRFNPQTLTNGHTTVFLNISLRTLENTPAIANVLVGALLNSVFQADGKSGRVLFLLDEAARLGKLKPLETARDYGRKYGISLHLLFQSIGQMAEAWGRDGTRAWIDAASWVGYAAIRAGGAGKDLSEQLGTHGVLAYSEGDNSGTQKQWGLSLPSRSKGGNTNVHEISRRVAMAAELQQSLRADEAIIVPDNGMPIRCGRPIYFRRKEMVELIGPNRFVGKAA